MSDLIQATHQLAPATLATLATPVRLGAYIVYPLPEQALALASRLSATHSSRESRVEYSGAILPNDEQQLLTAHPTTLTIARSSFFVRCLLPIESDSLAGVFVWAQIAYPYYASLIDAAAREQLTSTAPYGVLATALTWEDTPYGIFSTVGLQTIDAQRYLTIIELCDWHAPFPGCAERIQSGDTETFIAASLQRNTLEQQRVVLDEFERAVLAGNLEAANAILSSEQQPWTHSARGLYAIATFFELQERISEAREYFALSGQCGHPIAWDAILRCNSKETAALREAYPDTFEKITRGERHAALTGIRDAATKHPGPGNAVLAFCLRGANEPAEGVQACITSLETDRYQPDVLGHLWNFYNELQHDEEAFSVATEHVQLFPNDPQSLANVIHSLLLAKEYAEARIAAERYLITSNNAQRALNFFFAIYEASGEWATLRTIYEAVLPQIPTPSADTLLGYTETLTECAALTEAEEQYNTLLLRDPTNERVAVGYARCLARADREQEAEAFLQVLLHDRSRIINTEARVFLVATLCEIKRRRGNALDARNTFEAECPIDVIDDAMRVGPMPAIEYIEILAACGEHDAAQHKCKALQALFPDDPYVKEVENFI